MLWGLKQKLPYGREKNIFNTNEFVDYNMCYVIIVITILFSLSLFLLLSLCEWKDL